MDPKITQSELEARALQIMSTNPDPNQLVSKIFGPLENWIMEIGPYKLMLIPWTQMWWQYDRAHETWDATGLKAGTVQFVLVGDEIEARPVEAPLVRPVAGQPISPGLPLASEPIQPELAPEAATMVEMPAGTPYAAATVVQERPVTWKLVFKSGPRFNESVILSDSLTLGREKDNQVVLLDPKVSRHHAVIQRQGESGSGGSGFVLVDKGSSNGTFLNGQRLSAPAALKNNDKITIGGSEIIVNVS